jgi:hypothetical protein
MKRIYIAGPMSGVPDYNYPAFDDAEVKIVNALGPEVLVLNPANNHNRRQDLPRWHYISKTLEQLNGLAKVHVSSKDECMVVTLSGWEYSQGARLEVEAAHQLGLEVYSLDCVLRPHWATSCRIIPGYPVPQYDPECGFTRTVEFSTQETIKPDEPYGVRPQPPTQESIRASVLDEAKRLVCGDRNNQYGPPGKDFNRTANALTSLGFGKVNHDGSECEVLSDHDVSIIMIVLKLSRLMWSPEKRDSWVDVAGYAGCGAEVAGAGE